MDFSCRLDGCDGQIQWVRDASVPPRLDAPPIDIEVTDSDVPSDVLGILKSQRRNKIELTCAQCYQRYTVADKREPVKPSREK